MTGGPDRRDESVSFSLKQLMSLEDERIRQERDAAEARERAARVAREEAGRRERAELQAREQAAEEERERARFRTMEEEARLEAMQRAAVEQARITVEARARAEESERERRHEIELQRMRNESVKPRGPGMLVASALGGAALAFAVGLVLHLAVWKAGADARVAQLDRAVAAAEAHAEELGRRVEEQKVRIADLDSSLAEARRAQAQAQIERARPPKQPTPPGSKAGVVAPSRPKPVDPNDGPPCPKFDPICGHIDR
jgi:colicin import membrane protein